MTETLEIAGALEATDEMLMKEISRRRQGALVELYGRHGQRLRTTVESVLREGADADDILQEIFLQIWKEADHYSPKDGRPLGWLITIARRRAIDRCANLSSPGCAQWRRADREPDRFLRFGRRGLPLAAFHRQANRADRRHQGR